MRPGVPAVTPRVLGQGRSRPPGQEVPAVSASADVATTLLQAGVLLAAVLLGRLVAARHLQTETIPSVLRGRVERSSRLCPWLLLLALSVALLGATLRYS